MKLYRFSPIKDEKELYEAIKYIHFEGYKLCKQSLGKYLPNAGNMGVFCHYEDEYEKLTEIRKKLTESSDNWNQKYFKLHKPIVIPARGDVPKTTYTYLYIRRPNIRSPQVGDLDYYLEDTKYRELKQALLNGNIIKGMQIFDRPDLDMIELYDPDSDVVAYVSTNQMTKKVRIKQSGYTKL